MAERTQAGQAYNELSHRILIGEIPASERIVEEAWADRLGVNRAAIRESLTRLLGEGLVRQGERGGFFVAEMSDDEIREVREVREILETAAFRLACDRATPKQVKEIAETCDDFASFVKKGYLTAAHEADLCTELGLRYNSLALVDNYANGLEGTEIDFAKFGELVKSNQARVNRLFERMLEILA